MDDDLIHQCHEYAAVQLVDVFVFPEKSDPIPLRDTVCQRILVFAAHTAQRLFLLCNRLGIALPELGILCLIYDAVCQILIEPELQSLTAFYFFLKLGALRFMGEGFPVY